MSKLLSDTNKKYIHLVTKLAECSICVYPCLFFVWLAGLLVGLFVSRTAQKLLNRFPQNLDGVRVSALKRAH